MSISPYDIIIRSSDDTIVFSIVAMVFFLFY